MLRFERMSIRVEKNEQILLLQFSGNRFVEIRLEKDVKGLDVRGILRTASDDVLRLFYKEKEGENHV